MKTLGIGCVVVGLLIPAFKSGGASLPSKAEGHRSGLTAKVISADGASRTIRLEGVGCSESMCSRVFIRSKSASGAPLQTWLDSIARITDITGNEAMVVMKDGTERRLGLIPDFRVLYVSNSNGRAERLDLSKIKSLELVP